MLRVGSWWLWEKHKLVWSNWFEEEENKELYTSVLGQEPLELWGWVELGGVVLGLTK